MNMMLVFLGLLTTSTTMLMHEGHATSCYEMHARFQAIYSPDIATHNKFIEAFSKERIEALHNKTNGHTIRPDLEKAAMIMPIPEKRRLLKQIASQYSYRNNGPKELKRGLDYAYKLLSGSEETMLSIAQKSSGYDALKWYFNDVKKTFNLEDDEGFNPAEVVAISKSIQQFFKDKQMMSLGSIIMYGSVPNMRSKIGSSDIDLSSLEIPISILYSQGVRSKIKADLGERFPEATKVSMSGALLEAHSLPSRDHSIAITIFDNKIQLTIYPIDPIPNTGISDSGPKPAFFDLD